MARNVVQFQKGLSEPGFEQQSGTEEQCRAVVIASRWPNGFECPVCGCRQHSLVTTRDLYQCTRCRLQTSPFVGRSSHRRICRCGCGFVRSIT